MQNIMENKVESGTITTVLQLLRLTYGIIPIVAGLDKFTNFLTKWELYIHPTAKSLLPFDAHVFMMFVGVIEIIAGIIVLLRPAVGGLIVAAWLVLIALSLIAGLNFIDVAVRDIVMAIGAFTMARLATIKS